MAWKPAKLNQGTGPRYFLLLVKTECEIYKTAHGRYPENLSALETDMENRHQSIESFRQTKGIIHDYEITESSANFFRARSYNQKHYPDYVISSQDNYPQLVMEESRILI